MFSVYIKDEPFEDIKKFQQVYAVQNDKNGYPHFLIRYKNQWKWISAKHCATLNEAPAEVYAEYLQLLSTNGATLLSLP